MRVNSPECPPAVNLEGLLTNWRIAAIDSPCSNADTEYFYAMSLADVEQIALKLSETDRALLASVLLESVAPNCLNHAADEFERREREMDRNHVDEISYEELIKRVGAERRQ